MIHIQAYVLIEKPPQEVWQQAVKITPYFPPPYLPSPQNPYRMELPSPQPEHLGLEIWLTRFEERVGLTLLGKITYLKWILQPLRPSIFEINLLPREFGQHTQLAVEMRIKIGLGFLLYPTYRRRFQNYLYAPLRDLLASWKYAVEHDISIEAIPKEALALATVTIID